MSFNETKGEPVKFIVKKNSFDEVEVKLTYETKKKIEMILWIGGVGILTWLAAPVLIEEHRKNQVSKEERAN